MLLLSLDMAISERLSGCDIGNGIILNAIHSDKHRELKDKAEYPAITFKRIDRTYDLQRFTNDVIIELYNNAEPDNPVVIPDRVTIYEAPRPYNFMYQVEILSKEMYHTDLLEMFIEGVINARGDSLSVQYTNVYGVDVVDKLPIRQSDYKPLDEVENGSTLYRRVYTFIVKTVIDFSKIINDSPVILSMEIQESQNTGG